MTRIVFSLFCSRKYLVNGTLNNCRNVVMHPYKSNLFSLNFQVAQTDHKTFRDLIWHLIHSQRFQSDLEKARSV